MKKYDLFLFMGQSNMQGQTESLPEDNDPVPSALEYKCLTDELTPLVHPVGEIVLKGMRPMTLGRDYIWDIWDEIMLLDSHDGNANLVPYFAAEYVAACDRGVLAVHAAKGSTKISEWAPDGARYRHVVAKTNAALEKARSQGIAMKDVFVLWLQGESDALDSTTKDDYKTMLTNLKNALVRDLGIKKFGIIKVGRFALDERDEIIQLAQEELCAQDGNFAMITRVAPTLFDQPGMMNPNAFGHYSTQGVSVIGKHAGRNYALINDEKLPTEV